MLSGQLPFSDESPELLIQSHLNDSTPRLPSHLQALQPLVEGLMRKDAAQRIASSSEIRELLNAVNDDSELKHLVIRNSAIDTHELSSLFADLHLRPDELEKRDKRLRRKRQRRIALQLSLIHI